jgi:uncharacterized protein YndB with AHSA1/START domain
VIDILAEANAIYRSVSTRSPSDGNDEAVSVVVRRTCAGAPEDVWDALTNPDRIHRWFLPLSGDLKTGGTFQLEGHAGGEILVCDAPQRLRVTFGGPDSVVELRLTAGQDGTTGLELEHTVPLAMAGSGAGALFVGPGWDGALLGLGWYMTGHVVDDPAAYANSIELQEFHRESIRAWTAVIEESGTADADQIVGAQQAAIAQYTPDLPGEGVPEDTENRG